MVYCSRGMIPSWWGGLEASMRQNGRNRKLGVYNLKCKHQAEKANWRRVRLYTLKVNLQWGTFPNKATLFYNLPQKCHQLETKCSNAWAYEEHFSFKPSHCPSGSYILDISFSIMFAEPQIWWYRCHICSRAFSHYLFPALWLVINFFRNLLQKVVSLTEADSIINLWT